MTEEEARAALVARYDVPRETLEQLERFVLLLREAGQQQNLIAASTFKTIWGRHILDSAQLLDHVPQGWRNWIDLGSGAGFPGLIVAALTGGHVTLVESRRMRAEFLSAGAEVLGLTDRVVIEGRTVEKVIAAAYDVVSARAFAPLPKLLDLAHRFATNETKWVLPKGRNAASELEAIRGTWQGDFRIEPSLTDPESAIIIASHVHRRRAG